jgi:cytidine deaminase
MTIEISNGPNFDPQLPALERIDPQVLAELELAAREAHKNAYTPYSNFKVGAAILTGSGKIYSGCNVENASYGMSNCAERTAIFKAISEGESTILAVVVYTPTKISTPPCGACRQVINEFGPKALIISICDSEDRKADGLDELLQGAFGPRNLSN